MIEYGCPHCGRRAFDAASVLPVMVEWICKDHGKVQVVPRYSTSTVPAQRTLKCTNCERTQHIERPVNDRTYCAVCGTQSVVIIAELGAVTAPGPRSRRSVHQRPNEARVHARDK